MNFFDTNAGYNFCSHTIPRLIKAVETLTKELVQINTSIAEAKKYDTDKEFAYILQFVKEAEDLDTNMVARQQLRSLWTAYCLHAGYDADTAAYDEHLSRLWDEVISHRDIEGSNDVFDDYECFGDFMCEDLV